MSCVIVLTPIVIASWPTIAASVMVAAAAMGFSQVRAGKSKQEAGTAQCVDLEVPNVNEVADGMGRDESMAIERDGVKVTFSKDARGRLRTEVKGHLPKDQLKAIGDELSRRIVQQYVYRRMTEELAAQGFVTVDENQCADNSIRLRVKRFGGPA